jgi:hypothetical protein
LKVRTGTYTAAALFGASYAPQIGKTYNNRLFYGDNLRCFAVYFREKAK